MRSDNRLVPYDLIMSLRRFRFRIIDLLLVTIIVALTMMVIRVGPIAGTAHSPILFVLLAGAIPIW